MESQPPTPPMSQSPRDTPKQSPGSPSPSATTYPFIPSLVSSSYSGPSPLPSSMFSPASFPPSPRLRKRRPSKKLDPPVKKSAKSSTKKAKFHEKGIFLLLLCWIYAYSLGPVITVIAYVFTFLFVTIPTAMIKICNHAINFIFVVIPAKISVLYRSLVAIPSQTAEFIRVTVYYLCITLPTDVFALCKSWFWTNFVQLPTAATSKLLRHAERFGQAIWVLKWGFVSFAFSVVIFKTYIHSILPYCDPWRDNSVGVVSGFSLSGIVSDLLLFPCTQAGASRDSAITNFVQFNHLSNLSEALVEHKIDYAGLFLLSQDANTASDSLMHKRWRREPDRQYYGFQDLENSLQRIGPFALEFLRLRKGVLDGMRGGLSLYKSRIDLAEERRRWKKEDFSISEELENVVTKEWARKIILNNELTYIGNQTLNAVKPEAEELYAKLGEGKALFEKIGHYFVLNRYLQRVSARNRDERHKKLYERLGGRRVEIDGYANAISSFQYPRLELAIDDYLLQFRQARKLLKSAMSAYGKDNLVSLFPPFTPSKSETKERLAKAFALQGKRLNPLNTDLKVEGVKTKAAISAIEAVLGKR